MRIQKNLIDFNRNYNMVFDHQHVIFLIIVQMHLNGLINDKKLAAMFRGLNDGTLMKRRNVYHCKINDSWHNDEGMYTILFDVYDDLIMHGKLVPKDIPMEVFIGYVQRLLNKPKNFCIDHIISEYVLPLIKMVERDIRHNHNSIKQIQAFGDEILMELNFPTYERFEPSGYCCEDCDGDYREYKSRYYEYEVSRHWSKDVRKLFKTLFNKYRDKSYLKNPTPCNLLD